MAGKYHPRFGGLVRLDDGVRIDGQLRAFKDAFSLTQANYERFTRLGDVPWVYEHDCHLLYLEGDGIDQFLVCVDTRLFG